MTHPTEDPLRAGRRGADASEAPAAPHTRRNALALLNDGELTVVGRLVDASNATLYGRLTLDGLDAECVYKPVVGERPLWDFPDGTLAARETAAYLVSESLGWGIVPPTVLRDGPFGHGMCQLWIDVDDRVDLVSLARSTHPQLRRMAVFDVVVNNADRKGGHLLPTCEGHVYGVDHGVCFAVDPKLRTILWQWRGRPLTGEAQTALRALDADLGGRLGEQLSDLLADDEVAATADRVARLLRTGRHPAPSQDWPAVPWPPF